MATLLTHGLVGAALFGVAEKDRIHWPLAALAAFRAVPRRTAGRCSLRTWKSSA